jgi:hypothetical protein
LYLWNGRRSNPLELQESKLLAHQVRNEAGAYKVDLFLWGSPFLRRLLIPFFLSFGFGRLSWRS